MALPDCLPTTSRAPGALAGGRGTLHIIEAATDRLTPNESGSELRECGVASARARKRARCVTVENGTQKRRGMDIAQCENLIAEHSVRVMQCTTYSDAMTRE